MHNYRLGALIAALFFTCFTAFTLDFSPSMLEKHILAGMDTELKSSIDIFTGEFPILLSLKAVLNTGKPLSTGSFSVKDFTVYTGLPRFFPIYGGFGTYNEAGYIDMYSSRTLVRSIGMGAKLTDDSFRFLPYAFLSSKYDDFLLTGIVFLNKSFDITAGLFLLPFSFMVNYADTSGLSIRLTMRLYNNISMSLGINGITGKNRQLYFGFGLSHREAADNDYRFGSDYSRGAHRGSILKYPENTLPAFKYAENKKFYDFIEFDVYRTKDNHYVVVHDPILLRYTGELKLVTRLTLKELKKRDMGKYFNRKFIGTRILSLEELSEKLKDTDKALAIEIKGIGGTKKDVEDLLAKVKSLPGFKNKKIIYLSLDWRITRYLKGLSVKKVAFIYPIISLSDLFSPVLSLEIKHYIRKSNADMIFFYTSKLDKLSRIKALSKKDNFDFAFWNFHDIIHAYENSAYILKKQRL